MDQEGKVTKTIREGKVTRTIREGKVTRTLWFPTSHGGEPMRGGEPLCNWNQLISLAALYTVMSFCLAKLALNSDLLANGYTI